MNNVDQLKARLIDSEKRRADAEAKYSEVGDKVALLAQLVENEHRHSAGLNEEIRRLHARYGEERTQHEDETLQLRGQVDDLTQRLRDVRTALDAKVGECAAGAEASAAAEEAAGKAVDKLRVMSAQHAADMDALRIAHAEEIEEVVSAALREREEFRRSCESRVGYERARATRMADGLTRILREAKGLRQICTGLAAAARSSVEEAVSQADDAAAAIAAKAIAATEAVRARCAVEFQDEKSRIDAFYLDGRRVLREEREAELAALAEAHERELLDAQRRLSDAQERCAQYEAGLSATLVARAQLSGAQDRLLDDLATARAALDAEKSERATRDDTIAELRQTVSQLRDDYARSDTQLQSLHNESEGLRMALSVALEEVASNSTEIQRLHAECDRARAEGTATSAVLESQRTELSDELSVVREARDSLAAQLEQARELATKATAAHAECREGAESSQRAANSAEREVGLLREEVLRLRSELREAEAERRAAEAASSETRAEAVLWEDRWRRTNEDMEKTQASLRAQLAESDVRAATAEAAAGSASTAWEALRPGMAALTQQLQTAKDEFKDVLRRESALAAENLALRQRHAEDVAALQKRVAELKLRLRSG